MNEIENRKDAKRIYKMREGHDWSCRILLRVGPEPHARALDAEAGVALLFGYIFVIKRNHECPQYKLIAGDRERDETPVETALRWIETRTGLALDAAAIAYAGKQWQNPRPRMNGDGRWELCFAADVPKSELAWMHNRHRENGSYKAKFFTVDDFYRIVRTNEFFEPHYAMLKKLSLILPFDRDKAA